MPLATKSGSLIVKGGSLAENCNCCGGWYCFRQCASCPAGTIPASLKVSVDFKMGDGSTSFEMRLVRMTTDDQTVAGVCPTYYATNGDPRRVGYDPNLNPKITMTINDTIVGTLRKTYDIGVSVFLVFGDSCYGNEVTFQAGYSNYFDLMQWRMSEAASSFVSNETGMCYRDFIPPVMPISFYSINENKTKTGTLQMSVISAE
jgi:hypothetical protein